MLIKLSVVKLNIWIERDIREIGHAMHVVVLLHFPDLSMKDGGIMDDSVNSMRWRTLAWLKSWKAFIVMALFIFKEWLACWTRKELEESDEICASSCVMSLSQKYNNVYFPHHWIGKKKGRIGADVFGLEILCRVMVDVLSLNSCDHVQAWLKAVLYIISISTNIYCCMLLLRHFLYIIWKQQTLHSSPCAYFCAIW